MNAAPDALRDLPVLVVRVDDERFGLRIEDVHEVVRGVAVTPLPGAPSVVEGVIDFRGRVIPVLSLRRRFGMEDRVPRLSDRFVIADVGTRMLALRADSAEDVARVEGNAISAAESMWAFGKHVAGALRVSGALILFADIASFLSQTEDAEIERAIRAANRE
jgi:purine-binding chemotaxis protein CheW